MVFEIDLPVLRVYQSFYLLPPLAVLLFVVFFYFGLSKERITIKSASSSQAATSQNEKTSKSDSTASKSTQWYRDMFFRLQHLEDHTDVLEPAREELLAMFSRGISLGVNQPQGTIFSVKHYDEKSVWDFLEEEHDKVLTEWESYLERRKHGQGPELCGTVEAAKEWLVQQAPVKFVDGAWLAHTNKITSPFALRGITKAAWQILSEELGDGDLSKHHVHLYRKLLEDIGCPLPDGHSADFIKPSLWNGVDNDGAWEAAVGQLLISLFPNEFLPEILGFNMHYELVTLDTMRATYELKALGINPYYFLIHIAIDNADSGHTAMATHTVTRYLNKVRATEGEAALEQAWKRVQIGYTLSQTLGSSESLKNSHSNERERKSSALKASGFGPPEAPLDPLGIRVVDILKAKAPVSHQFHCQSRVRIGGKPLAEWLAPSNWRHPHPQQHLELLKELSKAKPWIYPGASSKSLLIRELSWEGRMFGAFTHDEVVALTAWIDSLDPEEDAGLYWGYTRKKPLPSKKAVRELQDPARHHPVVMTHDAGKVDIGSLAAGSQESVSDSKLPVQQEPLAPPSKDQLSDVIALWFAHIGLLENTINTPSRTASPLYASILRLLRAQAGFDTEKHIVAGMDEEKRVSCPSLVDIGLELVSNAGWANNAKPSCLQDVFSLTDSKGQGDESAKLAHNMLLWGSRPSENLGWLLGLALAFLELKVAVTKAKGLLAQESRQVLSDIVARERQSLEECTQELENLDEDQYRNLIQGNQLGRNALEKCL